MRRSPFSIFRENAKVLMVVLIALAMFAFIIMDQLSPQNFPYVIGFLAGAGLFWLIGRKLGKPAPYAIAGAALGLGAAMLFLARTAPRDAVVTTTAGHLSQQDLELLVQERRIANQFLYDAVVAAAAKPSPQDTQGEQMYREFWPAIKSRMAQQRAEQSLFGFGYPPERTDEDVVFGWLLRQEAEAMGIRISDAAVNEYIRDLTNDQLSRDDVRGILQRRDLRQGRVYDALRGELLARRAWDLTRPAYVATPRQYWDDYKKLNVRATLEVAPVAVAAFAGGVSLPPEKELDEFFEKYKQAVPQELGPGEPGFLQPPRVRLAYLQADLAEIQKTVAEPTAAEIAAHYYENIESYPVRRAFDDFDFDGPPREDRPIDPAFTPEEGAERPPQRTGPPTPPSLPGEAVPLPATEPAAPADSDSPDGEGAAALDFDRLPLQFVAQPDPVDADSTKPAPAEPPAADAVRGPRRADSPPEPPQLPPAPDDAEPSDDEFFPDGPELPPAAKRGPPEPPPVPRYRPLDDKLREEIGREIRRNRTRVEMARRTDEAVKRMRKLSTEHAFPAAGSKERLTREDLDDRLEEIGAELGLKHFHTPLLGYPELSGDEQYAIGRETVAPPDEPPFSNRTVSAALAAAFDPGLLTYQPAEAVDEDHDLRFAYWKTAHAGPHVPLWRAVSPSPEKKLVELNTELGGSAFPTVSETLSEFLVRENGGRIPSSGRTLDWNQYRIVVEEAGREGIRKVRIEEPGIREQVEQAWKTQQARPKAEARATELAATARAAGGTLADSLDEQTITGGEQSAPLDVELTNSFSWYRLSSAPGTSMGQPERPERSEIPAVPKAGEDFMETVFEKLKTDEVGVAPNADRTVYYVLRVVRKTPEAPAGDERFLARFLQEDVVTSPDQALLRGSQVTPYEMLSFDRRQALVFDWAEQLRRHYDLKRHDPRGEPR
ncbi:MAG: hypothetical protein WED34_06295 [Planctomycetales bacterium]